MIKEKLFVFSLLFIVFVFLATIFFSFFSLSFWNNNNIKKAEKNER